MIHFQDTPEEKKSAFPCSLSFHLRDPEDKETPQVAKPQNRKSDPHSAVRGIPADQEYICLGRVKRCLRVFPLICQSSFLRQHSAYNPVIEEDSC